MPADLGLLLMIANHGGARARIAVVDLVGGVERTEHELAAKPSAFRYFLGGDFQGELVTGAQLTTGNENGSVDDVDRRPGAAIVVTDGRPGRCCSGNDRASRFRRIDLRLGG